MDKTKEKNLFSDDEFDELDELIEGVDDVTEIEELEPNKLLELAMDVFLFGYEEIRKSLERPIDINMILKKYGTEKEEQQAPEILPEIEAEKIVPTEPPIGFEKEPALIVTPEQRLEMKPTATPEQILEEMKTEESVEKPTSKVQLPGSTEKESESIDGEIKIEEKPDAKLTKDSEDKDDIEGEEYEEEGEDYEDEDEYEDEDGEYDDEEEWEEDEGTDFLEVALELFNRKNKSKERQEKKKSKLASDASVEEKSPKKEKKEETSDDIAEVLPELLKALEASIAGEPLVKPKIQQPPPPEKPAEMPVSAKTQTPAETKTSEKSASPTSLPVQTLTEQIMPEVKSQVQQPPVSAKSEETLTELKVQQPTASVESSVETTPPKSEQPQEIVEPIAPAVQQKTPAPQETEFEDTIVLDQVTSVKTSQPAKQMASEQESIDILDYLEPYMELSKSQEDESVFSSDETEKSTTVVSASSPIKVEEEKIPEKFEPELETISPIEEMLMMTMGADSTKEVIQTSPVASTETKAAISPTEETLPPPESAQKVEELKAPAEEAVEEQKIEQGFGMDDWMSIMEGHAPTAPTETPIPGAASSLGYALKQAPDYAARHYVPERPTGIPKKEEKAPPRKGFKKREFFTQTKISFKQRFGSSTKVTGKICSTCGKGEKANNCVSCGKENATILSRLCQACASDTKKAGACISCGRPNAKIVAKLCDRCRAKAMVCIKCGNKV